MLSVPCTYFDLRVCKGVNVSECFERRFNYKYMIRMYILNYLIEKLIKANHVDDNNLDNFLYEFDYINVFLDDTKKEITSFTGLRKALVSSYNPEIKTLREITDKLFEQLAIEDKRKIQETIYTANLYLNNETTPLLLRENRNSDKTLIDAHFEILDKIYNYVGNNLLKNGIDKYIGKNGVYQLAMIAYAMASYKAAITILAYFSDTELSVNFINNFPTLVEMAQRDWSYKDNKPNNINITPIQKHTTEKKSVVFPLAEKIWSYDKNTNLLMRKQVAELVVELLPSLELRVPQVDKWLKDSYPVPQAIIDRCARNDYGNKKHETIEREKIKNKIYVELSNENSKYL